ncbi:MAG: hypothetical protein JO010_02565, partial [Alphaproteobacteria bacterium]|nr:hypothetical protein [Alphaproteobacteria bacterium]
MNGGDALARVASSHALPPSPMGAPAVASGAAVQETRNRALDFLRSRFGGSALCIGLALLLLEAILLAVFGGYYLDHLTREVAQRSAARLQLPGRLMQEGLLRLASAGDRDAMVQLVGADLAFAMVVAGNLDIVYATEPGLVGRNLAMVPGIDPGLLASPDPGGRTVAIHGPGGARLAAIAPLRRADGTAPFYHSIIAIDGAEAAGEKAAALRMVLLGSLLVLGLSATLVFSLLARRTAERANRAKSAFLAVVSHELRTPLNAILGILDLLHLEALAERQRSFLGICQDSASALMRLIDDILDFASAEAGALKLVREEFSLREIVEEVTSLLSIRATERKLDLVADVDPRLPPRFEGDRLRIKQILLNLVGNAIKFTEAGHVALTVSAESVTDAECAFLIEVSDTGSGLSEAQQARLFRPFVQLGQASARHGGVGLGLLICRQLVTLMGGTIGVRSQPGAGATFW